MAEKTEPYNGSLQDADKLEFGVQSKEDPLTDESSGEGLITVDKGFTDVLVELPPEEARRAIKKVDFRLVPLLAVLYLVAFVDRSNIGNAKIAGLEDALNLEGLRYNTVVTLFFVPYALLEVPSNIVLKLWRPSLWISILMFCWGLVMTLMGIVSSYSGLLAARFFLGVAEVCCSNALSSRAANGCISLASFQVRSEVLHN